eukprot:gene17350-22130_t
MLHIILFEEMDAIMKTRGSTRDNTIDGVDSFNNILIIDRTPIDGAATKGASDGDTEATIVDTALGTRYQQLD